MSFCFLNQDVIIIACLCFSIYLINKYYSGIINMNIIIYTVIVNNN